MNKWYDEFYYLEIIKLIDRKQTTAVQVEKLSFWGEISVHQPAN